MKTSTIFIRVIVGIILCAIAFAIWALLNPVSGRYGGLMTLGYLMISGLVIALSLLTLSIMGMVKWFKNRQRETGLKG